MESGWTESGSSIIVSSEWVNRIDYILHIYCVQMHVYEILNIALSITSARVWAHRPSMPWGIWKTVFRMNRKQIKMQGRFRSKLMGRRSSNLIIPAWYWPLFSIQSLTNGNSSVRIKWSGSWMAVRFANWLCTVILAISIQFQAYLEPSFWNSRSRQNGSLWGDGFGMQICQEHWWQMKWPLRRCLTLWQRLGYANCQ